MNSSERLRTLLSPLNVHLGGVLLFIALNVYLVVRIAISIGIAHSNSGDALEEQRLRLSAATVAALPLRGLDNKLSKATADAAMFEKLRMPTEQSDVIAELGELAHRNNVRLSRVQYAPIATPNGLSEYSMDASLTGDYRPLVQFINSVERDKIFFVINGVTLSGQQGGIVTLKIRLTTWLRPISAGDKAASVADAAKEGQ